MKNKFRTHATTLMYEAVQAMLLGELMVDEPLDEGSMGHSQIYRLKEKRFIIEGYVNSNKITIQEVE